MANGNHPRNALSAARVRSATEPGRYADGSGLYLVVDPSGAKRWLLRTVIRGKRCDVGLGSLRLVSLAEAREQAKALRAVARRGGDPLAARRRERRPVPTFREASIAVHASYASTWRNSKHSAQWLSTLEQHVYPTLGERPVSDITTADVLKALSPIWLAKAETARRVRQRISTVLDWAKASAFIEGENPVAGVAKGLPRQSKAKGHHAALPFGEVPDFVKRLRASDAGETVKLAFEFLILTAARTGEVIGARWDEVDIAERCWTIEPRRMKTQRQHRVPLDDRTVEILVRARQLAGDSVFVFPGRTPEKPVSNMVFLMTLRRMGYSTTTHGFRSAFRDWASETTNFSREVCELALAHAVRDRTEAAYRRGDLLAKRRELMTRWGRHVCTTPAKLVRLRG